MQVHTIVNNDFKSNTYFVENRPYTNEVLIIDPGGNEVELLNFIRSNLFEPQYILLTHEHFDHITGTNCIKQAFPDCKIICSEKCAKGIVDPKLNLSAYYGKPYCSVYADIKVDQNGFMFYWKDIPVACFPWEGHSLGGMFFSINDVLFCGDQFIKETKTVVNLPGGNKIKVKESLTFLMNNFHVETLLYPGHGDTLKIADIKCEF